MPIFPLIALAAACAAGLACHWLGEAAEREDLAAVAAGDASYAPLLGTAAEEGTLSPAAAELAAAHGLLSPEKAAACSGESYAARWGLVTGKGVPYEALWWALFAALLGIAEGLGAPPPALGSIGCALASAAADRARRMEWWPLPLAQWALGSAAAGLSPLPACLALAGAMLLMKASGALLRKMGPRAVGRGDDLLLACAAAGCGSLERLLAMCLLLCLALAAQAIHLRLKGEKGVPQPLAASLAPPYLLSWVIV